MDPITIAVALWAAATASAIIYVAFLSLLAIRDHLREKRSEASNKAAEVIMKQTTATGEIKVITGFFDGNGISHAKTWEAEDAEDNIKSLPENEMIVIK